jgi:hypothetical protein
MIPSKRPSTEAEKLFAAGLEQAQKFERAFQHMREYMICAGLFFSKAKDAHRHGDWELFVQSQGSRLRTVQAYMAMAAKAVEWAKKAQPQLVGTDLEKFASKDVTIMSPREFVALCRELRKMRRFGEYDKSAYDKSKLIADQQLELDFEFSKVLPAMDWLARLSDPKSTLRPPDGKSESEAWSKILEFSQQLAARAQSALSASIDV